jgi:uncharacterized protein (DUF58 family)
MTRLRAVVALAALMLVAGLATGRTIFYNVFFLLLAVIVLSYLWAWSGVNWLRLTRQTRSRRAQVGRPIEEAFRLRNIGPLPKLWLEVLDASDLPGHRASHVANNIPTNTEYAWSIRTYCLERGRYRLGPITLASTDPFGLFTIRRALSHTTNVVVYPATFALRSFPMPIGTLPGGDALRRRTHQITANASGVREYYPGDGFNRIHWPSTARKGRLLVKEFELDPMSDVWIFLDMASSVHFGERHLDPGQIVEQAGGRRPPKFDLPASTEEYCISVAASIAQFILRKDQALGLVASGQRWETVQADRGERQVLKILETLSVLRAEGGIPLHEILYRETVGLARGSTLIIVTPSVNPRWARVARHLSSSGLRVVAVLIDPESFGGYTGTAQIVAELEVGGLTPIVVRRGANWVDSFDRSQPRVAHWSE